MATHSSVLAWRIPGTGEPSGMASLGSQSRTWLKRPSSSRLKYHIHGQNQDLWSRGITLTWWIASNTNSTSHACISHQDWQSLIQAAETHLWPSVVISTTNNGSTAATFDVHLSCNFSKKSEPLLEKKKNSHAQPCWLVQGYNHYH